MPDYKNGKIYKLWSIEGDDIYIGSTTDALHKRLNGHKTKKNKCNSKILFEKYNDVKIELIEEYPCENKQQLNRREGEIMRLNKKHIVNHCIAGRTVKEFHIDNVDRLNKNSKQYHINNKEKIHEQKKQYYIDNIDKIKERKKQYNIDNTDKIKEQNKQKYLKNKLLTKNL